jgi:UDP-N-acetylglucosamine enolpyruvyl transferase
MRPRSGAGRSCVVIDGVDALHGVSSRRSLTDRRVVPAAAAATAGEITLENAKAADLAGAG